MAREENRGSEDALDEFASDAFVESVEAFFVDDSDQTVQGGFVSEGVRVACLEATLYDAEREMDIGSEYGWGVDMMLGTYM